MSRRALALVVIGVCGVILLIQRWVMGADYENPWFVWLPILLVLGWSMWQLREKLSRDAPVFDFNPGRGLLFFCLGWIVFPAMLAIDALFGANFSLVSMLTGTALMSVLIGALGTFTQHVGV